MDLANPAKPAQQQPQQPTVHTPTTQPVRKTGLACETTPEEWNTEHAALIDQTCLELNVVDRGRSLAAASNGWRGARPARETLAELESGVVPWPHDETRFWVGFLDLTPMQRDGLIDALTAYLSQRLTPRSRGRQSKKSLTTLVDALHPTPPQRAAAVQVLQDLLNVEVELEDLQALEALNSRPKSDDLARAALEERISEVGEVRDDDDRVLYELAEILLLCQASEAVWHEAAQRLVTRLKNWPNPRRGSDALYESIAALRPDPPQRAATLGLLLRQPASNNYDRELLRLRIEDLLPPDREAGMVLRHLVQGGPWNISSEARGIVQRLAARSTAHDQDAVLSLVAEPMNDDAFDLRLLGWVDLLAELVEVRAGYAQQDDFADRRTVEVVVDSLLARLSLDPLQGIFDVASSMRRLGGTDLQRARIVQLLVEVLTSEHGADMRLTACEFIGWFSPDETARIAAVTVLEDVAASLQDRDLYKLRTAVMTLRLMDTERHVLASHLTEHLTTWTGYHARCLVDTLVEIEAAPEQRSIAAATVLGRLSESNGLELSDAVAALRKLDPPSDWITPTRHVVLDAFLRDPTVMISPPWPEMLSTLEFSVEERQQLLGALLPVLGNVQLDNTGSLQAALDFLEPPLGGSVPIAARLIALLNSTPHGSPDAALKIVSLLSRRPLTVESGKAVVRELLARIASAPASSYVELLEALRLFPLDDNDRQLAVSSGLNRLQLGGDMGRVFDALLELGELDPGSRVRITGAVLDAVFGGLGGPDAAAIGRLQRLRFDGEDLLHACERVSSSGTAHSEYVLRKLAGALRRSCRVSDWLQWLPTWQSAHSTLYSR